MEQQNEKKQNSKLKIWGFTLLFVPTWLLMATLLGAILVGILSAINGQTMDEAAKILTSGNDLGLFLNQIVTLIASVIAVWIFWSVILKKKFLSIGLKWTKTSFKQFYQGIIAGAILLSLCILVLYINGSMAIDTISFNPLSFLIYLLTFALVAFNEELVMRGFLMGNLMTVANKYFVLIFVAALFSAAHFFNPAITLLGKINIVFAGLLLGIPYIYTKNLWFPIGLHLSWNFLQGPVFGSPVSGNKTQNNIIEHTVSGNSNITGGEFGFEGSLVLTVIMIVLIVALDLYFRKQTKLVQ